MTHVRFQTSASLRGKPRDSFKGASQPCSASDDHGRQLCHPDQSALGVRLFHGQCPVLYAWRGSTPQESLGALRRDGQFKRTETTNRAVVGVFGRSLDLMLPLPRVSGHCRPSANVSKRSCAVFTFTLLIVTGFHLFCLHQRHTGYTNENATYPI